MSIYFRYPSLQADFRKLGVKFGWNNSLILRRNNLKFCLFAIILEYIIALYLNNIKFPRPNNARGKVKVKSAPLRVVLLVYYYLSSKDLAFWTIFAQIKSVLSRLSIKISNEYNFCSSFVNGPKFKKYVEEYILFISSNY